MKGMSGERVSSHAPYGYIKGKDGKLLILLLSPSLASSTDKRQYRAVMASGANTLRIEYKVFMAVLFVSFIVVCNIITSMSRWTVPLFQTIRYEK